MIFVNRARKNDHGFLWGMRDVGGCGALGGTSQQRRSRLLAPRLGRGSLCGDGWWVRVIFGGWCRFAQDDTWGAGAWDGGLMVGVGGMRDVGAFACFALIRHWRATFPTRGKAFGAVRCFMLYFLASEIPPAGAPLGAGFAVRQWLVGARDFWWVVPLRSG